MKILLYLKSKDFTYGGPAYVCESLKKFFNKYQLIKKIEINIRDDNDFKSLNKKEINLEILKYDLVSIHGIWSFKNSLIASICRESFIPYTICLHGMLDPWSWKKNFFFKLLFYLLFLKKDFRYASSIHCLNKFEYELTKKYLKSNNVFVFENLLDISSYNINEEAMTRKKNDKINILYFGRITEKKGLDKFISAIYDFNKDFLLKIVGPANTYEDKEYFNKIKKMVKDLKLENKVEFGEPVRENEKKSEIINKADFFVLPSMAEGDSVALKESVLHGLPLIITKNCKFYIENNNQKFGYYINNDFSNVKDILKHIIEMNENEHLNLRKNALAFSEKFKISKNKINELYQIYENIIRSKNNHNIFKVE